MIGYLRTRVREQPITALYFESAHPPCRVSLEMPAQRVNYQAFISVRMCQALNGIVGKLIMMAHSIISELVVKFTTGID